MTKRILALLLVMLMVITSMFMTACKDSGSDDEDASSEAEGDSGNGKGGLGENLFKPAIDKIDKEVIDKLENEGTKQVLGSITSMLGNVSTMGSDGGAGQAADFIASGEDLKVSFDIKVNDLDIQGEGLPTDDAVSFGAEIGVDVDNLAVEMDLSASLMGDKITAAGIANLDGVWVTDLLGVNDKAIAFTFDDLGFDESMLDELEAMLTESEEMTEEATAYIDALMAVINAAATAIDTSVTDDDFASSTGSIEINGKKYDKTEILTLTVDDALVQEIAAAFINNIKNSEEFKPLAEDIFNSSDLSDIDAEELASEIYLGGVLTVECYEVDGETIAVIIKAIDEDGESIFFANVCVADNNVNISVGDEYESFEIVYTLDGDKELLELNTVSQGESTNMLRAKGTYKSNTHKGTLYINAETTVSVDYEIKLTDSSCKFAISNINIDGTVMDVALTFEMSVTSKKVAYSLAVDVDVEGVAIDAKMSIAIEMTDLDIQPPKSSISMNDVDESTLEEWGEKLMDKLPNIMGLLTQTKPAPDYDYDFDYDYAEPDYDFDYDFEY